MTTGWVNECNGRLGGEEMKNQRPPRGEGGEKGGNTLDTEREGIDEDHAGFVRPFYMKAAK